MTKVGEREREEKKDKNSREGARMGEWEKEGRGGGRVKGMYLTKR